MDSKIVILLVIMVLVFIHLIKNREGLTSEKCMVLSNGSYIRDRSLPGCS